MQSPASVSVIIVSRDRPTLLRRCLRGLSQVQHPNFEIVVVADQIGLDALSDFPFGGPIKSQLCATANISVARNLGLFLAAGDIVAFIDDDAVSEPAWLQHLMAPFNSKDVAAAGGFVRGRNGISLQWRAMSVDAAGFDHPLHMPSDQVVLWPPQGSGDDLCAIKTQGTNCAFRRSVLIDIGGFDPSYAFFLDETDVNMRLARAGWTTAIVPLAQVHHGFAASAWRTERRVPKDLTQEGRSLRAYHDKFATKAQAKTGWQRFYKQQEKRLLSHMLDGALAPSAVRPLLQGLHVGYQDGPAKLNRDTVFLPPPEFKRFAPRQGRTSNTVLAGRRKHSKTLRAAAQQAVSGGSVTTLYLFSLTSLYHQSDFTSGGYWEQRGGLFGRSGRHQPLIKLWTVKGRRKAEYDQISPIRTIAEK